MTKGIVYPLEVIDIQDQYSTAPSRSQRMGCNSDAFLGQRTTIGDTAESVNARHLLQLLGQFQGTTGRCGQHLGAAADSDHKHHAGQCQAIVKRIPDKYHRHGGRP